MKCCRAVVPNHFEYEGTFLTLRKDSWPSHNSSFNICWFRKKLLWIQYRFEMNLCFMNHNYLLYWVISWDNWCRFVRASPTPCRGSVPEQPGENACNFLCISHPVSYGCHESYLKQVPGCNTPLSHHFCFTFNTHQEAENGNEMAWKYCEKGLFWGGPGLTECQAPYKKAEEGVEGEDMDRG